MAARPRKSTTRKRPARTRATKTPDRGKVTKVLFLDEDKQPIAESSTQLPDDKFGAYSHGIQEPPFPLEQLLYLAEMHPVHNSAMEQKAVDIVGGHQWTWKKVADGAEESQRANLEAWLEGLVDPSQDDITTHELLLAAWLDLETVGHGTVEVARDTQGVVRRAYHVPAHTTRFHKDGLRIVQIRGNKRVWFKRWLPQNDLQVDRVTGKITDKVDPKRRANEMLVFKRPSRRSDWYGIPTYVAALGWIHLSVAARDDNIQYFANRREPRWVLILKNLEENDDLEEMIRQAIAVDLKQPHRNLIIPIEGSGDIEFKQLTKDSNDMSFERLQRRGDDEVLIAHRIPGDRLGLTTVGPLGGNVALASSSVYKEAVVQPSQALLAARLNAFMAREAGPDGSGTEPGEAATPGWRWEPKELDLTTEVDDERTATSAFKAGYIIVNEARNKIGLPPLEDGRGDMLITDLMPSGGAAAAHKVALDREDELGKREAELNERIHQLLTATRPDDE